MFISCVKHTAYILAFYWKCMRKFSFQDDDPFYSEPFSRGTRGPAGPLVPLLTGSSYYCCKICCTTVCTRFEGIAKLTPFAAVFDSVLTAVNVGIPMSCPCKLIKAPPLFPGFTAASVWIALETVVPVDSATLRLSALTIPLVAVSVIPNGLPIAITSCPTTSLEESPIWATVILANG